MRRTLPAPACGPRTRIDGSGPGSKPGCTAGGRRSSGRCPPAAVVAVAASRAVRHRRLDVTGWVERVPAGMGGNVGRRRAWSGSRPGWRQRREAARVGRAVSTLMRVGDGNVRRHGGSRGRGTSPAGSRPASPPGGRRRSRAPHEDREVAAATAAARHCTPTTSSPAARPPRSGRRGPSGPCPDRVRRPGSACYCAHSPRRGRGGLAGSARSCRSLRRSQPFRGSSIGRAFGC